MTTSPSCQRDQRIAKIVSDAETPDYDDPIASCDDPKVFWNLSSLRRGLLGWLPVMKNRRVLEIGAGFGALTGGLLNSGASVDAVERNETRAETLRRRYEGDDKLRVLCQDVLTLPPDEPYDAIVLARIPKSFVGKEDALFDSCARLLKKDGFLLAGFNNRFGLRYWRGGLDDRVATPFAPLEGDSDGLYTRSEFESFAVKAGLCPRRSFFPFPNELFPLTIYTEKELPGKGLDDRLFSLDPWNSPVLCDVRRLYAPLFHEGLLPGMADYALILFTASEEYAARSELGAVDRVVLSADRGRTRSAAVRLYADGRVEKSPLYPEGAATLRRSCESLETLRSRGLAVVEGRLLENGSIRMPRVVAPTLLEFLETVDDKETLFAIFDQLERDVLRSAPVIRQGDCAANSVLESGFIDMTPFNIFWLDGKLVYFDQEFSQPNCPVGYVLYRTLVYAYYHVPTLEKLASLEEMKERYRLAARWSDYEARENAFLEEARSGQTFRQVFRWSKIDRAAVIERRQALLKSLTPTRKKYPIGLLMGVFDMFHVGHLNLIERAKEQCAFLRVAVLNDELVFRYKKKRPVIPQEERMRVLASVREVDEVVCIEDEPSRLLEFERRPFDCFFSGDDYRDNEYWKWEREELRKLGADIVFFSYTASQSSTKIRAALHERKDENQTERNVSEPN